MTSPDHHVAQAACGASTEDRALCLGDGRSRLVVIADGVGGLDDGGEAAELVVETVAAAWRAGRLDGPATILEALMAADRRAVAAARCGQATAVVVVASEDRIYGASVGDSEAWLVTDGRHWSLTAGQRARPLIGGGAIPVSFSRASPPGAVIVAGSDGLFRRVAAWRVAETCRDLPPAAAGAALVELVRLPDGRFADDVSVVIARLPGRPAPADRP